MSNLCELRDTCDASVFHDENKSMDLYLKSENLWRKPLPRDGNSLFRAIAEHIYASQSLYPQVKMNYLKYISNHLDQFGTTDRIENILEDSAPINIYALSQLYRVKFRIYEEATDVNIISNDFTVSDRIISLSCMDEDHYDLVYPDFHRVNLAFVQSVFYHMLYKNVYQIDLPFSNKHFTLQSIRDPYFFKQDAFEFSHLERCFNILYYENVSLSLWKSGLCQNSSSLDLNLQFLKFNNYSLGDQVRVYSPNTENKPYYIGKIINLNVTPGMHEVLAPNRGTEIVDIGHLKPVCDENDIPDSSSVQKDISKSKSANIPSSNEFPIFIEDSKDLTNDMSSSFNTLSELSSNDCSKQVTISSRSSYVSNSAPIIEVNDWDRKTFSHQVPPGFEEEPDLVKNVKHLGDGGSTTSSDLYSQRDDNFNGSNAPKHKYGPQSAAVKQKFQAESSLKELDPLCGMKPFEQIYETAHSQIKKLQFKLNNSTCFLSPKFSIHPEGSDLPDDKFILQYFYNLGVQYQLMRSHGSSWKDVLPNSCPPLYHDSNYHASNQLVPLMFRDTAGIYFSQDMVVPNYFYDMTMMPFIQGYAPPLTYNLQGEPFMAHNYGKHFKEDLDPEKIQSSLKSEGFCVGDQTSFEKSNSLSKLQLEVEVPLTNTRSFDRLAVQPMQIINQKKPLDDPQNDPTSWPQPGGDKDEITWTNNDLVDNQKAAYSNVLKKGTQCKQPSYTAERTIYASNNSNSSVTKSSQSKRNYVNLNNVNLSTFPPHK